MYIQVVTKLRILSAFGLAVLLIQGTPLSLCAARATPMPCCTPSSDCGAVSFSAASCCRLNAPADRQEGADRTGATPRPSLTQTPVAVPMQGLSPRDDGFASAVPNGSPPQQPRVPLYLKFASLLC